jgi:hypothetical protein
MPFLSRDSQTVGVGDMQKLIERCQTRTKGSTDDVLFRCVSATKDGATIAACMKEALSVLNYLPNSAASPAPAPEPRPSRDRFGEAELQLAKIRTNAKAAFNTDASYPTSTPALTPATPCCEHPGHRCLPEASDWAVASWQALDFQLDEPFDFQYQFTGNSSGTEYVAIAVGDPGCTGNPTTFELRGAVKDGVPVTTLTKR